jgi:hypothetical protein
MSSLSEIGRGSIATETASGALDAKRYWIQLRQSENSLLGRCWRLALPLKQKRERLC